MAQAGKVASARRNSFGVKIMFWISAAAFVLEIVIIAASGHPPV